MIGKQISLKQTERLWGHARQMIRLAVARHFFQLDYRGFAVRLADSSLLQSFCMIYPERDPHNPMSTRLRPPGKSTLQALENQLPEKVIRDLCTLVTRMAAGECENDPEPLGLAERIELENLYLDTTCLEANIHYPVDWRLLGDAVRTMMLSVIRIRKAGLVNRMENPKIFMRRMNVLSMQMTQVSRGADSKNSRKRVLRKMKKLVETVRRHAQRHRELLTKHWQETDLSEGIMRNILWGLDNVLDQIKEIIHQAHERIIGGRKLETGEKILSLYEHEINVMVRKKTGHDVEFGNALSICEQKNGLIVDWYLYRDRIPSDSGDVLPDTLNRVAETYKKTKIQNLTTDRGFDCARNRALLEKEEITNGMCPKRVTELTARMSDPDFARHQVRRAQTEGRIGILKNVFLRLAIRTKEFDRRERAVTWGILTHNLWVLARLPVKEMDFAELNAA
jgi:hypothetical protein